MSLKDAYYFPHDAGARNDPSMLLLRSKFGVQGYGSYFMIIEVLREQKGYKLPITPQLHAALAFDLRVTEKEVRALVDECVKPELRLLRKDKRFLWSDSLRRRMGKLDELRAKRSEAGGKGAAARWHSHSGANGKAKKTDDKSMAVDLPSRPTKPKREIGGAGAKAPASAKRRLFAPPSLSEVTAYCNQRKNGVDPSKWHSFYSAKGWMVGKNKMVDWQAAVRTWEGGDDAQIKKEQGLRSKPDPKCSQCHTNRPLPFSIVCKQCSWCIDCDRLGKPSEKEPKDLKPAPKGQGVVCPECMITRNKNGGEPPDMTPVGTEL